MMKWIKKLNNQGNVSVLMCVALVGILGVSSFAVDIGQVYIERERLMKGIDAAALAAALELPNDKEAAYAVAVEYLQKNRISLDQVEINIADNGKSITIQATKDVNHLFASIIGIDESQLDVANQAIIAPLKSTSKGIRPFAVEVFNYTYGDRVILKEGAGDGYHGNYGAIRLGGSGAANLKANVLNGYKGTLSVGDIVETEPGNMSGVVSTIKDMVRSEASTFENFNRDSIRVWTIPIVNTLLVDGAKPIKILGFAEFYIEDIKNAGGKTEMTGRFIRYVGNGEVDTTLTEMGAYGAKLVK